MADSVPDNETFSLQDIIDVVGGSSLQECFDNAVLAGFDGNYDDYVKGSTVRDSTYNFRNYHLSSSTVSGTAYSHLGLRGYPVSGETYAYDYSLDFESVRNSPIGVLGGVDRRYFQCNVELNSGIPPIIQIHRTHLRFDLLGFPPGATIVSARMRLRVNTDFGPYGTEYSAANNYGEISVYESLWGTFDETVYGSIEKDISGLWKSPMFNGITTITGAVKGADKNIYAIESDYPRLRNYFGTYLYITLVTRQDRYIISPGYNQKLGVYFAAPEIYNPYDPHRTLKHIIEFEYIP